VEPLAPAARADTPWIEAARPLSSLWKRRDTGWALALWLLVTLRIELGAFALFSLHLRPMGPIGGQWSNLILTGPKPWSDLIAPWQRWDALWYQEIAEHGYHAGNDTIHFEPLFPLLSRIVSIPLFGNVPLAALVVSSLAFLVAMGLLYRLGQLDVGPVTAGLAVLLVAFFPTGFFLLAPFTESLFLALSLAAIWYARQGRPWAAGLAAALASLTRTLGVFLVLPLAYEYLRQRRETGKQLGLDALAAGLPVLALVGLLTYWRLIVGEHRSALAVAADWGNRVAPPWDVLAASWGLIQRTGDVVEVTNLLCLVGACVLALAALRWLPLIYGTYAVPYLAFLAIHEWGGSALQSDNRYILVLFPCFLMLALWLARRPWLAASWLVMSLLFQALLLDHFLHYGWVA
jgi:hypothetical protein